MRGPVCSPGGVVVGRRGVSSPGGIWTPNSLAHKPLFWLDPSKATTSGGHIATLPDAMKGSAKVLTPSGTALTIDSSGAYPAVVITATDSQLFTATGGVPGASQPHSIYGLVWLPASPANYDVLGYGASSSNTSMLGIYNSPFFTWRAAAGYGPSNFEFNSGPTNGVGHWALITKEYDGSTAFVRVNGHADVASLTSYVFTTADGLGILSRNGVNGMVPGAKVAGAVFCDRSNGPGRGGDRWQIEAYFRRLMIALGESYPTTPYFQFEGDSLTQAGQSGTPWPTTLMAGLSTPLLPGMPPMTTGYTAANSGYQGWRNTAASGSQIADMITRAATYPTSVDQHFTPLSRRNCMWIWDGTNDIHFARTASTQGLAIASPSTFAAAMWSDICSYVAARRANGADLVGAFTLIARSSDIVAGHLATRQAFNALMLANVDANGARVFDTVIDLIAYDSRFGDYTSAIYFDQIHMNATGSALIVAAIQPTIQAWANL